MFTSCSKNLNFTLGVEQKDPYLVRSGKFFHEKNTYDIVLPFMVDLNSFIRLHRINKSFIIREQTFLYLFACTFLTPTLASCTSMCSLCICVERVYPQSLGLNERIPTSQRSPYKR